MYNIGLQQQSMDDKDKDKPMSIAQIERATSRRSRKDEEGRDFQCGCGKRYLSYPALYTHIKTKHDGVQPQGTLKTGLNVITKKSKGKIQQQTLKNINLNYVDRQDLKILKQFDGNYIGQVPIQLRIRKQLIYKQIFESYLNLSRYQQIKLNKKSSIDIVLAVYTLNIGQYVNQKLYDYYLIFARLAKNCYLEYGQQIYKNCFSKKQQGIGYIQNFTTSEINYFPIICDFLTRYYIPYCQSARQCKDINISLIQLLLYDFCNWLLKKNFTIITVQLKKQYKLDSKPFLLIKQKCHIHRNDIKQNDKDSQSDSEEEKKQDQMEQSDQSEDMDEDMNGQMQEQYENKDKLRGEIVRTIQIISNSNYLQFQQKQRELKNEIQIGKQINNQ